MLDVRQCFQKKWLKGVFFWDGGHGREIYANMRRVDTSFRNRSDTSAIFTGFFSILI